MLTNKIGTAYIIVLISRTTDTKYAMVPAKVMVKPFHTFPKQLQVSGVTYVTFVRGGIGHTYMKVVQVRTLMFSRHRLKGLNILLFG